MTIEEFMMFKRGNIKTYENIIKQKHKVNNKLRKINNDICWKEDILSVFDNVNESDRIKHESCLLELDKLHCDKLKYQEELESINKLLIDNFY